MSKALVTKLFIGGVVSAIAGVIVAILAAIAAFAAGVLQTDASDVVGINMTPFAWLMVLLAVGGVIAIIGGGIAGLVAWIGALLNTAELDDKTWFLLVLVLGIFNFGFIGMIVYILAGPDGTARRSSPAHSPA